MFISSKHRRDGWIHRQRFLWHGHDHRHRFSSAQDHGGSGCHHHNSSEVQTNTHMHVHSAFWGWKHIDPSVLISSLQSSKSLHSGSDGEALWVCCRVDAWMCHPGIASFYYLLFSRSPYSNQRFVIWLDYWL